MTDILGDIHKEFITFSSVMLNTIGILQRDAKVQAGDPLNGKALKHQITMVVEVRESLVKDFFVHSDKLDLLIEQIPAQITEADAVQGEIKELSAKLPEAIEKSQREREDIQNRIGRLEAMFNELVDFSLFDNPLNQ